MVGLSRESVAAEFSPTVRDRINELVAVGQLFVVPVEPLVTALLLIVKLLNALVEDAQLLAPVPIVAAEPT